MIFFLRIVTILLAILVITKSFYAYRKHNEILSTLIFWTTTWILIVFVSLKPTYVYQLILNFGEPSTSIGTFSGVIFIFLFFVVYKIYIKANRTEKQIRDIVMKLGLKDIDKE